MLGGLRMPALYSAGCQAIDYHPVATYQTPGGLRTGKLVLDHPEFAQETQESCSFRPSVRMRPEGFNREMTVASVEVAYEEPALAVFEVRRTASGTWFRGLADDIAFWVRSEDAGDRAQYFSYEKGLVQAVGTLSEACDDEGHCSPLPHDIQLLADEAGAERADSCLANAYDFMTEDGPSIEVLPNGRHVYHIRLAASLTVKYGKLLPAELRVPTYDYSGRWTGFYLSRGC